MEFGEAGFKQTETCPEPDSFPTQSFANVVKRTYYEVNTAFQVKVLRGNRPFFSLTVSVQLVRKLAVSRFFLE